jgi:hypothetical protein
MTWHTQLGRRVLQGAEAALIREAIAHLRDTIEGEIAGYVAPWDLGVVLFDRLEPPARLALLAEVGWALLRETESCPRLTAVNEAAVAAVFRDIEQMIQYEIDSQDDMDAPDFWRSGVLAVFEEDEETTDLDLPEANCTDRNEWDLLLVILSDRILWDDDFQTADPFLDAPPDKAGVMRSMMAIDDDYYRAVPPDPTDSDLERIRATLGELRKP